MDFTIHRRAGGATYGKNRNKVLVHNFFDDLPKERAAPAPVSTVNLPMTPSSASSTELKQDTIPIQPMSPSPAPRHAHITAHLNSSHNGSEASRSVSPMRRANMSSAPNDLSVFDLSPSDEDVNEITKSATKRRKLKHTAKTENATDKITKPVVKQPATSQQVSIGKTNNAVSTNTTKESEPPQASMPSTKRQQVKSSKVPEPKVGRPSAIPPKATKRATRRNVPSKEVVQLSSSSESEDVVEIQKEDMLEHKSRSILRKTVPKPLDSANLQQTPKKTQAATLSSDTPSPSPSHLALFDLQLSSNSPSPQAITGTHPLPRGRKRLIDRLDAPPTNSSRSKSPVTFSEPVASDKPVPDKLLPPPLERSNSSQARQKYGKPRNVYGRERSHLADMVDDLDMLNAGSSQEASQQLVSQLAAANQSSQLQMELELESDSSDDLAIGGKLKSIHELRQAGSVNRFERDLEALMEDVDPTNKTSTMTLRIQALMKVIKNSADNDFTSFFSDRGLDRLMSWYPLMKDSTSQSLATILLWRVSHLKSVSSVKLKKIADILTGSTSLLTLETTSEMIKSRGPNLGKNLLRELSKFEAEITSQKLLAPYNSLVIIPAAVALGTLNRCLRQLLDTGETEIPIDRKFLTSTFGLLSECAHRDLKSTANVRFTIQCIFSVLEMCTGPLDIGLKASTIQLGTLAQDVGSIIEVSLDEYDEIVQSALRFAISFCNNRPDVCHSFSSTQLIRSQMKIIRTRFLRLVGAAERGEETRQDMVDSIILCLACLLNLTEHEDDLRSQVAHTPMSASTETSLQALVSIYKSAAPVLVGATADGHGQILVAFGYLSLLLCTLSLGEGLRTEIDALLGSYTMTDVVVSGKELLMHLSTLDAFQSLENGGDVAERGATEVNEFTKRFGQILTAVRLD